MFPKTFPPSQLSRKLAPIVVISLWWILFAMVSFIINWVPATAGFWSKPSLYHTILWHAVWLLWIPLTYIVFLISSKYPVKRANIGLSLLFYFALGCFFTVLHTGLDCLIHVPVRRFLLGEEYFDKTIIMVLFTNKFSTNLVIFWSITGACQAYFYFIKFRKTEILATKLENELTKSQLQTLKMQLHPHFLFNTHHSIVSLMTANRNTEAIAMITQLSDLLRITLEKKDQQLASLAEEMNIINLYLNIQKIRFKGRISIEQKIETETLCASIPTLLLQPIVENAFKHGIERAVSGGNLLIESKIRGKYLEVIISDSGSGEKNSHVKTSLGIGLQSTQERLNHIYGRDCILKMNSHKAGGTTVTIEIPFQIALPVSGNPELENTKIKPTHASNYS